MLLIDLQERKILAVSSPEHMLSEPFAQWVKDGRAKWVEEVAGIPPSELSVAADGNVSVDPAKQAAKQAAADARAARKAAIKGAKSANSVAALRAIVLMLAEDLGYEVDA